MTNALVISYMEQAEETLWQSISMIHAVTKAEAARGADKIMNTTKGWVEGLQKKAPENAMLAKVFPKPLTGPGADEKRFYDSAVDSPKYRKAPLDGMGKGERAILTALAQAARPRTQEYVGIATNYSCNSGTFKTYLSRLRTNQWITGGGDALEITDAGKEALGDFHPLPTGESLIKLWLSRLGKGEGAILAVAVDKYPDAVTPEYVGQQTDYSHTSGTFKTYLSRLRTLRLIDARGDIRASDELMGGT